MKMGLGRWSPVRWLCNRTKIEEVDGQVVLLRLWAGVFFIVGSVLFYWDSTAIPAVTLFSFGACIDILCTIYEDYFLWRSTMSARIVNVIACLGAFQFVPWSYTFLVPALWDASCYGFMAGSLLIVVSATFSLISGLMAMRELKYEISSVNDFLTKTYHCTTQHTTPNLLQPMNPNGQSVNWGAITCPESPRTVTTATTGNHEKNDVIGDQDGVKKNSFSDNHGHNEGHDRPSGNDTAKALEIKWKQEYYGTVMYALYIMGGGLFFIGSYLLLILVLIPGVTLFVIGSGGWILASGVTLQLAMLDQTVKSVTVPSPDFHKHIPQSPSMAESLEGTIMDNSV